MNSLNSRTDFLYIFVTRPSLKFCSYESTHLPPILLLPLRCGYFDACPIHIDIFSRCVKVKIFVRSYKCHVLMTRKTRYIWRPETEFSLDTATELFKSHTTRTNGIPESK